MAEPEWFVAQDTFNAELPGGGQQTVQRGSTWHKSEHVVQLDGGRGVLFVPQRSGEDEAEAEAEAAPKRPRAKRDAVPAAGAGDDGAGDGA